MSLPVIIMAGGRGTRLRPFTNTTPKPLIQVGNLPLVAHNITALARSGFKDIYLSLNYMPEQFRAVLGDGLSLGARIQYYVEPEPLGTAGSIPDILKTFSIPPSQELLVLNADIITDLDWRDLSLYHNELLPDATVVTYQYTHNVEYGVVTGQGHVSEKPTISLPILAGIYILSPAAISAIPPKEASSMPDIINMIADQGTVLQYEHRGLWMDVGRPADLETAREKVHLVAA